MLNSRHWLFILGIVVVVAFQLSEPQPVKAGVPQITWKPGKYMGHINFLLRMKDDETMTVPEGTTEGHGIDTIENDPIDGEQFNIYVSNKQVYQAFVNFGRVRYEAAYKAKATMKNGTVCNGATREQAKLIYEPVNSSQGTVDNGPDSLTFNFPIELKNIPDYSGIIVQFTEACPHMSRVLSKEALKKFAGSITPLIMLTNFKTVNSHGYISGKCNFGAGFWEQTIPTAIGKIVNSTNCTWFVYSAVNKPGGWKN